LRDALGHDIRVFIVPTLQRKDSMQFVDRALAVRLEAAEDLGQIHYAQALAQEHPEADVAIEPVAGGHMVFAGCGSPIGRAIGCGLTQPVTVAGLDAIEHFYFSRGVEARIDVPPLAEESLLLLLQKRRYRLEELNNVLARKLAPSDRFSEQASGFAIRAASKKEAATCARILAQCFEAAELANLLVPMFRSASVVLVAEVDGTIVATGDALIAPQHQMVALHGAGTLPPYRGRGIQTALMACRLNEAVRAGSTLALIVTRGGTTSQRNAERLGFTLAYTKAVMKRGRDN